jgi:hypothetical protein
MTEEQKDAIEATLRRIAKITANHAVNYHCRQALYWLGQCKIENDLNRVPAEEEATEGSA